MDIKKNVNTVGYNAQYYFRPRTAADTWDSEASAGTRNRRPRPRRRLRTTVCSVRRSRPRTEADSSDEQIGVGRKTARR